MPVSSRIDTRIGYLPTIIKALIRDDQSDKLLQTFKRDLGPYADKLVTKYQSIPTTELKRKWDIRTHNLLRGDLGTRIIELAKRNKYERDKIIDIRRTIIRKEFDDYLRLGRQYQASAALLRDSSLLLEAYRYFADKTGESGCRCEKPEEESSPPDTTPPPSPKKYGVYTTRLKCFDQCEAGHDEVYLVCCAVDGNGKVISSISPRYSIDDDDDDVLYPRHWIYPTQVPNGFLDVAITMMEDDGDYGEVASAVSAIGSSVGAVGSAIGNPIVVGAGVAVVIIGEVINIVSSLDEDECYGTKYKTWPSLSSLGSGAGTYKRTYSGEDWSGDSYDFDLTIQLLEVD